MRCSPNLYRTSARALTAMLGRRQFRSDAGTRQMLNVRRFSLLSRLGPSLSRGPGSFGACRGRRLELLGLLTVADSIVTVVHANRASDDRVAGSPSPATLVDVATPACRLGQREQCALTLCRMASGYRSTTPSSRQSCKDSAARLGPS